MADPEYVAEEFEKARQALADAEQLAAGSGSDEGIVNRLYYAAFHAAQAVLYDRDVAPSSHGAIRNRFGEAVVLESDASREQGRLLTRLADLRQQADYGYEPIDADVDTLKSQTEAFLADMEELVGGDET